MSAETLIAKLQKLPVAATAGIVAALDMAGSMLQQKAILEINTGGRAGRMYGNHQASMPGEYPKTVTGALVASIQKTFLPLAVTVGTSLDHGRYLEFGTSRMAARPWLAAVLQLGFTFCAAVSGHGCASSDWISGLMDAAVNILAAVDVRLKAFSALTAITNRIYSAVPQQTAFPYVNTDIQSQPFAANDFSGQQHTLRVQAHSQSGSKREALDIRQQVFAALDRQEASISVSGVTLVKCEFTGFADCFIEDDGKTWQSIIEFTMLTM